MRLDNFIFNGIFAADWRSFYATVFQNRQLASNIKVLLCLQPFWLSCVKLILIMTKNFIHFLVILHLFWYDVRNESYLRQLSMQICNFP